MPRLVPGGTRLPPGPAPLYSRLYHALRERLASGEWRPGDRIPTIRQLGELYGVSRITVVQALDTLARDGLLRRWQGKGVFVSQLSEPEQPRLYLQSFTEQTIGRGQAPTSRTMCLRREPPDPALSARLDLKPGEGIILLQRLRLVDGTPLAIQRAYLPEHLVPGLLDRAETIDSLYEVLARTYGILPTNATETYVPVQLVPDEARFLEAQPGTLGFQVDRTTSDQHGRTIEFSTSVLRADKYELRLLLARSPIER
jgi:GntR family transcriptional regulator